MSQEIEDARNATRKAIEDVDPALLTWLDEMRRRFGAKLIKLELRKKTEPANDDSFPGRPYHFGLG